MEEQLVGTLSMSSSIDDDMYIPPTTSRSTNDDDDDDDVDLDPLHISHIAAAHYQQYNRVTILGGDPGMDSVALRAAPASHNPAAAAAAAAAVLSPKKKKKKKSSRNNQDAFSSSSEDNPDDEDSSSSSEEELGSGGSSMEYDENGSDDGSEDGSEDEDEEDDSGDYSSHDGTTSEFDRALHRGKGRPSRGNLEVVTSSAAAAAAAAAAATSAIGKSGAAASAGTNMQKHKPHNTNTGTISTPPPPPPQQHAKNKTNVALIRAPVLGVPSITHSGSNLSQDTTTTTSVINDDNRQHLSNANSNTNPNINAHHPNQHPEDPLASGVLPDVLMTMRQKIESLTLFDSDMMKLAGVVETNTNTGGGGFHTTNNNNTAAAPPPPHPYAHPYFGNQYYVHDDAAERETRESLKRSSQQSISAAVLVSLAHKRYERRRLAAMEIEKVVRSLVQQQELDRVRAILLLLSDDYVRSTSEDARKGGVVALAASAIGLKRAPEANHVVAHECRDLILASVVHACQDHSQRVRYYATESLFNVVKVMPSLAVQHFFILFEILRSLYADVDADVKSGAELLDKKLKEVIVGAMNSGQFTADACVPVFARFVYMRNKATKRLTLTWLQELAEKLIGAPILEFLHLLLGGIFDMVADPTLAIRQAALAFLQSVLPKLLTVEDHVQEEAIDDMGQGGMRVDFDKILQSLVTTMEHPDPFVRKVAMYWMSRIVKAHIDGPSTNTTNIMNMEQDAEDDSLAGNLANKDNNHSTRASAATPPQQQLSAATISVRNSLPHVLPGILLSIGDTFKSNSNNNTIKDSFLPDQTTHALAEQTNACLQEAVRRDGHEAYVHHLDSFIVALREELDSPGGVNNARNPPAVERKPYRMDVKHDGTGIESQGWFRSSNDIKQDDVDSMMLSRLCALQWVIVLYESVVPDVLKADYAREFVIPIIHQLVDDPPEQIIYKSLEVLSTITVPVKGEAPYAKNQTVESDNNNVEARDDDASPMIDASVNFALDILEEDRRLFQSRDREVFAVLIQLHAHNLYLISDVAKVIAYMCRLQPPEFVFVSFAVELERFAVRQFKAAQSKGQNDQPLSRDLQFISSFIQQMCHVLLNSREAKSLRDLLKDCIGHRTNSETDKRRTRLFQIILYCFSHNLVASTALCLWGGAFRTASLFLRNIDPLDIHLMFLLEVDKLVEMVERPLFRHLHVRMLESDKDPMAEGSGTMLFQVLKSLLMIIPQTTCYNLLRNRLTSTSRFRQSVISSTVDESNIVLSNETEQLVNRVLDIRQMHCSALWETIRAESLETATLVSM